MGLQNGDVIVPNCPEYAVVFFAIIASGCTVSTLNPSFTVSELAYQLKDSCYNSQRYPAYCQRSHRESFTGEYYRS